MLYFLEYLFCAISELCNVDFQSCTLFIKSSFTKVVVYSGYHLTWHVEISTLKLLKRPPNHASKNSILFIQAIHEFKEQSVTSIFPLLKIKWDKATKMKFLILLSKNCAEAKIMSQNKSEYYKKSKRKPDLRICFNRSHFLKGSFKIIRKNTLFYLKIHRIFRMTQCHVWNDSERSDWQV